MSLPASRVESLVLIGVDALHRAVDRRVLEGLRVVALLARDLVQPRISAPTSCVPEHLRDAPDNAVIQRRGRIVDFDRDHAVRFPRDHLAIPHLIGVGVPPVLDGPLAIALDEELPAVGQGPQTTLELLG